MNGPTHMKWPALAQLEQRFGRIEVGDDGQATARWEARSLTTIRLPYPMRPAWRPEMTLRRMRCHRQVAQSLGQVLAAILAHYGSPEKCKAARMDLFGGVYIPSHLAHGAELSAHAYGAAIDLDPEGNLAGRKWAEVKGDLEQLTEAERRPMLPRAVVEIFEAAGWSWGGRWARPECGHFQATA